VLERSVQGVSIRCLGCTRCSYIH